MENSKKDHPKIRVVTKISSCRVNTTSRRGIRWLGISFGSIFLLFFNKSSRGPPTQQPGKIPGSRLLMTTLLKYCMVAVVYKRWLNTRSSNYKALTKKILCFAWISGCLWEVVAYQRWLHMEVKLYSVFIRHQRPENPPSTVQNSPASA